VNPNIIQTLIAHPGTQYAPRLAAELHRHGALGRFVTGVAMPEDGFLGAMDKLMPAGLRRRWANRRVGGVPAARLRTFPGLEWSALRRLRRGEASETVFADRNGAFQRAIPDRWIDEASHVIGFDTSSWLLAARAKARGKRFILDQSIGHPRAKERVYTELRERHPEWNDVGVVKAAGLLAAEDREHAEATLIVAASTFSRNTLIEAGVAPEKIAINPYGVDAARFNCTARVRPAGRPLRFLFVGLVNARKGVPTLLAAWRALAGRGAELWLVGPISAATRVLIPALPGLRIVGRLPHQELPRIFAECDVFVFPSFFEGFALVLLEALASGLPIVSTTATAAPDLITDGVEGFILEPGDESGLAERMERFIDDPSLAFRMGGAGRKKAEEFSWNAYGERWTHLLLKLSPGGAAHDARFSELPDAVRRAGK